MAIVQAVEVGSARRLSVASPADRSTIGEIEVHTAAQVRAAVARARAVQPAWEALGFDGRARYLRKALKRLLADQDHYLEVIHRDTGRSRFETIMMEVFPAYDSLEYYAKNAKRLLSDERRPLHLLKNKRLVVGYRPLGVVGIITPWNAPFILSLNPSVQALMAGNCVVLKPSEVTPFAGKLVAKLFDDVGLPAGVLTVVEGDGETGAALVESGVDKISFTGSVATGRKVGEACGRNLIPCTLELGGKDAAIVCADADLDRAAKGIVFGAFLNAGQFCCSTERVYVVEEVADALIEKILAAVATLRLGSEGEYDIGPMIWPRQIDVIEDHIEDARARGATIHCGGRRSPRGELFYEPTVLTGVTHDMKVMQEETFGPVLPIVRVCDEAEAVKLANDSRYGLSGTLWTRDDDNALALAGRMQTGSVCVNDSSISYGVHEAPFGGRKWSGVGQVNGETGLRGYCHAQPVLLDRFNQKEENVWYPYTADKERLLLRIMRWVWGTPIGRWMS